MYTPALFTSKKVRKHWNEQEQQWYFSIVDIIAMLTDSPNPQVYWRVLKKRMKEEGNETVTNCNRLKLIAPDGKLRETDVGTIEQVLRLIQSIPSPKAEPIKLWLAKVGYERLQEIINPDQSIDRAKENWQKLGRSHQWIEQRISGQDMFNKLLDYWNGDNKEKTEDHIYAPDAIHQEWTGFSIKKYKGLRGLKTRHDSVTEAEFIFKELAVSIFS